MSDHAFAALPGIGDPAPEFSMLTDEGKTLRLRDLRGKWVVLYWFPKADTPG